MVEFGDDLRLERERRGVSLETMCATTKLSVRQLHDVEAGNFRELPGGIFRKGFVRSYVKALGLDEPVWLERFEISYRASGYADAGEVEWTTFAENVRTSRLSKASSGLRLKWLGVLGMVLVLLVLGGCVWEYVLVPKLENKLQPAASVALPVRDAKL